MVREGFSGGTRAAYLSYSKSFVNSFLCYNSLVCYANVANSFMCCINLKHILANYVFLKPGVYTPTLKSIRWYAIAKSLRTTDVEDQRKLTAEGEKARKRKAVQDEIRAVESKRKLLEESIASTSQEADALTVQAEKKHSFVSLAQSNAFRQKIHESEANE